MIFSLKQSLIEIYGRVLIRVPRTDTVMLPYNASHSYKSLKLPYVTYLERIVLLERALLESWL